MLLKNKRILLISPPFFGYDEEIKNELLSLGADVFLYRDRPSEDFITKALIRINPKILRRKTHKYYLKIKNDCSSLDFDYILFIKCESALPSDIEMLSDYFKNAQLLLYLWDSIANIPFYDKKKEFFKKIYSFDSVDAEMNDEITLLPLFFIDAYDKSGGAFEKKYDLSFIGTMHSDRVKIICQILEQARQIEIDCYFRLYVQSRVIYILKFITSRDFRCLVQKKVVTCSKLSSNEISNIISKSESVLDINYPNQNGLTIRTIELLGMNKKILTTNKSIMKYNFYRDDLIKVLDRNNITLEKSFFVNCSCGYTENERFQYSLAEWCKNLFLDKERSFLE